MRIGKCRGLAILIAPLALWSCTSEPPRAVESIQSTSQASTTSTSWMPAAVMLAKRKSHAALNLSDGRVLVVGGTEDPSKTAESYDPGKNEWILIDVPSNVIIPAATDCRPALTQLSNGLVLVVSGETVWSVDLENNTWNSTALPVSTCKPKAVTLPSARALILADVGLGEAFTYDGGMIQPTTTPLPIPAKGTWNDAAVITLNDADRSVLISGGTNYNAGTILFNPATDTWVTAGDMFFGRSNHAIALLPGGNVLIAGGNAEGPFMGQWSDTAEIFSVKSLQWTPTTSMLNYRSQSLKAGRLPSGFILVVGGSNASTAELFDPSTNLWSLIESAEDDRYFGHESTVLESGRVLVTGGSLPEASDAASLCDALAFAWETRTSLPKENRAFHSATKLDDGRMLVVGGRTSNGDTILSDAWLYDPALEGTSQNPWSAAESPLVTYALHTATKLANGQVLVVGGSDTTSAKVFDPTAASNAWTAAEPLPKGIAGATATLLNDGRVLIVGGFSTDGSFSAVTSVYLYEPTTKTWTTGPALPDGIAGGIGHSATLLTDGSVLVIGGFAGCPVQNTPVTARDVATRFLPDTNTWESLTKMTQARAFHSATLLEDGRVVIAGGGGAISDSCTKPFWENVYTSTEIYNLVTNTWTSAGNMTEARTQHQGILLDNQRVLLAGGRRNSLGNSLSSAEIFDTIQKTWTPTSRMQYARYGHTLTPLSDGVIAIGGFQPFAPSSNTTSVERFLQAGQGSPCTLDAQCKSKVCSGGVCCETVCDSPCLACSKAASENKKLDDGICEDISGCAPYACALETGACGATCTDVDGCASGYVCDPTGGCIEPLGNASKIDDTGCTTTHADSNASSWASLALIAGGYVLRALRRRNTQRKS